MLLSLAWSGAALLACVAVGLALEEAASRQLLLLHLLPIGPSPFAADLNLNEPVPRPFGEHGWIPIPLALLDLCLVLLSDRPSHLWRDESWWALCRGPLWGQLPTIAVCTFTILPALLAAWLLWMPWQCSPLPVALAAAVLLLAAASLLFWADRLPLLPRAHASAGALTLTLPLPLTRARARARAPLALALAPALALALTRRGAARRAARLAAALAPAALRGRHALLLGPPRRQVTPRVCRAARRAAAAARGLWRRPGGGAAGAQTPAPDPDPDPDPDH